MPNFEVTATANVQPGVNGLKQVQGELAKTAVASQKMDSAIVKTGNTLNTGLKTGANQATAAMTNLGRVVQDAPFGFIGIANNLNPLLESFQRLKAETGSTGTALKALAGSLIGAGGLGFAVSIVSSLLTIFALNSRSAGKDTEAHKEKVDQTKKAAEDYSNAISAASSAVVSHQGKLVELNRVLADTSNNFNILSRNIINQALAEYLATQKEGLIKKILDAKVKEILEAQSAFSKVREYTDGLFSKDPNKKAVAEATADIKNLNNLVKSLGVSDLFKDIFKLDTIKVKPEKIEVEGLPKLEFKTQAQDQETAFSGLLLTPQVLVKPDIKFIDDPVQQQKVLDGLNAMFAAERLAKFQATATEAINATIGNIVNDSIGTMADAIGQALAGGKDALPNLFESLIRGIGSQIKELGKYLVKIGVQMLVAKEAVKALGLTPQGAIIAGIGLQVLAGALQAAFSKKIQGFATGVRDFGGGFALVGERGPELVNLPRGSGVTPNNEVSAYGGGSVVMIPSITLRGTDLVIAFNRASQQMSRTN